MNQHACGPLNTPWRLLLAIAACTSTVPAQAQSYVWPGVTAPCTTTLQACINGAIADGVVLIAVNDVINTGHTGTAIVLPRSVTLTAAPGFAPVFPIGVGIAATPAVAVDIRVSSITLRNAGLRFSSTAAVATAFSAERMRILDDSGDGSSSIGTFGAGPIQLRLHDNEYVRRGAAGNFVAVESRVGAISGEISFNRISIPDTGSSAYGVVIAAVNDGSFDLTVANNVIRSSFAFGGICALSVAPTGTPAASSIRIHGNVFVPRIPGTGSAICIFGGEGPIEARITNNTVIDHAAAISMLVRPFDAPATTQPISGYVIGNLLAYNAVAFRRDAIAAVGGSAVSNGQNLLFSNSSNFTGSAPATAGSGTVTSDPQLYSRTYPYLRSLSPAIGVGNPFATPIGYPLLDADGSRRLKDVGAGANLIDIGAFEFGDSWFSVGAGSGDTTANFVRVSHPSIDSQPAARLLATANFTRGAAEINVPFGVFYDSGASRWAVFNQNVLTNMPVGAGYSLFTPATGTGLFLHQVGAGGSLGDTILDNPSTNALPDQILAITSNWNPPGSGGVYNNRTTSVAYQADSRWRIRNNDAAVFTGSAAFNVYAQPPSPSAFRHLARPGNIGNQAGPGAYTILNNARLNGFVCAELMVTPLASFGDRRFDVAYVNNLARWVIFTPGDMPIDADFNVVFSPRQVTECGLPMFANGFEG